MKSIAKTKEELASIRKKAEISKSIKRNQSIAADKTKSKQERKNARTLLFMIDPKSFIIQARKARIEKRSNKCASASS